MEKSLRRVKNATVIDVPYARLSEQPQEVLKEIAVAAGVAGEAIDRSLENIPGSFETTDKIKIAVETAEELRNAVDKWTAIMS